MLATTVRRVRAMPFLRTGLLGQGLTFVAMVLPILFRATDQLFVLVICSAIATLLLMGATAGYSFTYPVARGPATAVTLTQLGALSLTVISVLVAALAPWEDAFRVPAGTMLAAGALLWTQGLYSMVTSQLVREHDVVGLGWARLTYGLLVSSATAVALLTSAALPALVYANAAAYALAVLALVSVRHTLPRSRRRTTWTARRRLARLAIRRAARPTATGFVGGWAFFLSGVSLPGLGALAEPWAVANRVSGGFGTLLQTIVAPPLEAGLAKAVRTGDRVSYGLQRRTALAVGLGTAALAVVVSVALAVYSVDGAGDRSWFWPLVLVTTLYWGALLAWTPVNRLPNFLGRDGVRLAWEATRAVAITVVFLTTAGETRLVLMGAVLTLTGVALLPMSRWRPATSG